MPAYNAAQTLEKTYKEIPFDIVDEVVLVDDVSKDNEDSDKAPEDDLADAGNLRLLERSLLSL